MGPVDATGHFQYRATVKNPLVKKKRIAKKVAKKVAAKKHGKRADFGAPIDGYFTKQAPHLRPILLALRELVETSAPDVVSSLKWGMPFYTVDGQMMCALATHKAHVNLILAGSPDAFVDRKGRLEGDAKGMRHLKVRTLEELPRVEVKRWLRIARKLAKAKAFE